MLFHGTKKENCLGILSRGMALPKKVVELGVERTDHGLLGQGLFRYSGLITIRNLLC